MQIDPEYFVVFHYIIVHISGMLTNKQSYKGITNTSSEISIVPLILLINSFLIPNFAFISNGISDF